ncbi:NAD(P)-binding protein [Hypoxylon rubiginosum]|uniref:NAD(P)-binding protein n=1 Tax=Hypoxylon rubiginosum TaxID=110542 RepID=A0ACC0DJT3_9PEZI|nr:NAD(P)-binding protein [Hypoxylon rubiginosum]
MAPGLSKLLYQAYMKWHPIPLPPADAFKGQAVLVTGGTSGLGLATAIHFINLGAAEVIITSRDASRAKTALATIERETGGRSNGRVRVMDLDMSRYASVIAFAKEVKKVRQDRGGLDVVILNAGVAGADFKLVDEGWEQNIQVNALSTTLLGLLLLPWLKAERAHRPAPAHLAVVSSSRHLEPDIQKWKEWAAASGGVLEHFNKPENWPGPDGMYAVTKLMAQYAMDELTRLALGPDGRPEVIVNAMCPGFTKSDLPRHYADKGIGFTVGIAVFTGLFAKSSSNGARTYLAACLTKESEHGKFIRFYGSDAEYQKQAAAVRTSEDGKKMQAQVLSEMRADFAVKAPEALGLLGS